MTLNYFEKVREYDAIIYHEVYDSSDYPYKRPEQSYWTLIPNKQMILNEEISLKADHAYSCVCDGEIEIFVRNKKFNLCEYEFHIWNADLNAALNEVDRQWNLAMREARKDFGIEKGGHYWEDAMVEVQLVSVPA